VSTVANKPHYRPCLSVCLSVHLFHTHCQHGSNQWVILNNKIVMNVMLQDNTKILSSRIFDIWTSFRIFLL